MENRGLRTFLTTKEVADLIKVNEKMVYTLISNKGLPATKVTGKWLFPKRLVEEWLEMHIVGGPMGGGAALGGNLLLIAGSDDPFFQKTMALFHSKHPEMVAFFANLGSMGGIKSLRRGNCHIGVCHLLQDDKREYNFDFAQQELDRTPVFVNFSRREQGLLVQRGNPKSIDTVADLARSEVTMVNRPLGTGTRLLLDYELSRADISTELVKGYQNDVLRHIDAGLEVVAGRADAAPAIRAVAGMLDLDFLPLRWERFDLLISRERFFEQNIQKFISILHDKEFSGLADSFSGYDISLSGKMIFPDNMNREEI